MRTTLQIVLGCGLAVACAPAFAQPIPLDNNWNGIVHSGEGTEGFADDPDGLRTISDRGMFLGTTDSMGGDDYSLTTSEATYDFEPTAGVLDLIMIGTRESGGQIGWDPDVDGDNFGIAPNWDPTGGSGSVMSQTTDTGGIPLTDSSRISLIYNGSIGGGDFDVILDFADGASVTVTCNAADWFADFDPAPAPPGPGVESQETLPGPLSGGDGFKGASDTDWALPGAPLAVFEAVVSAESLLTDLEFDIGGRTLESVTFDGTPLIIAGNAAVGIYGLAVDGNNVPLNANWNGMVNEGEGTVSNADEPEGYRSIGDRGFAGGEADSLGGEGFAFSNGGREYDLVADPDVVDMVMIGTRPAGWDDVVDGDGLGVAPNWDPSKGGGIVIDSITSTNVTLEEGFSLGVIYHATNGGGDFDVYLGFGDGSEAMVTLNSPDWYADGNPVPPAPNAGVESQTVVPGPLSGGDGFLATGATDSAIASAPLSAFEAVISDASLSAAGFNAAGKTLTSIRFDAINLLLQNPNAAVGIFGVSVGGAGGCPGDCDGNGVLNVLDFVCFQQEWQSQSPFGDCDGNGLYNVLDFVCFQQAFQAGCP